MSDRDPQHAILETPWHYDIESVSVDALPRDGGEPRLDLRLSLDGEIVELRFWSPREVQIGWPLTTGGLEILDLSERGMEKVGVEVADFEASPGGLRFYARAVERLSRAGEAG
jgi:hypothetical protein